MANSKGANTYNRQNWEDSTFPILCETCLGPSPFLRMQKETHGKECKICNRPFTVFRWCPGPKARFKKTEICQTCAKVKNVCQTCIFDLEYGLPVEVRDKALRQNQQLPRSDVNREYFQQQLQQQLEDAGDPTAPYGGNVPIAGELAATTGASSVNGGGGTDLLMKLARTAPYYKRNRPHICSFWVKGECKRGEECPYRHEKPTDPDDPLAEQNLKDRYYGNADPVAAKLLSKYESLPKLRAPEDKTITTLYIGNVPDAIVEKDLRDHFYQFGELRSVTVSHKSHCAFLQFVNRSDAERAAERSYDRLIIKGSRLTVNWGKPAAAVSNLSYLEMDNKMMLPPVPGLPLPPQIPPHQLLAAAGGFAMNPYMFRAPQVSLAPPVIDPAMTQQQQQPPQTAQDFLLRGPMPPPLLGYAPSQTAVAPPPIAGVKRPQDPVATTAPPGESTSVPSLKKPAVNQTETSDGILGVHYPSQNPQRLGSQVPTAQHHE